MLTSSYNTIKWSKPGNNHLYSSSPNLVTSQKFHQLFHLCSSSSLGSNQEHILYLFSCHLLYLDSFNMRQFLSFYFSWSWVSLKHTSQLPCRMSLNEGFLMVQVISIFCQAFLYHRSDAVPPSAHHTWKLQLLVSAITVLVTEMGSPL